MNKVKLELEMRQALDLLDLLLSLRLDTRMGKFYKLEDKVADAIRASALSYVLGAK